MSSVLLDMAISLDGCIAGENGDDPGLYDWYFAETSTDTTTFIKDELIGSIGAMILGKRAFGDDPNGFDTPYKIPHFVLSHEVRETVARDGMQYIFVTQGIEHALAQAKAAAGDKFVCVAGGAETARQFIEAGWLDEIQLHLVPVIVGNGLRLWGQAGAAWPKLEAIRVLGNEGVTHLRFRVIKDGDAHRTAAALTSEP